MYEIQLKERFAGYCVTSAKAGEEVQVQVSGITSTENGDIHLKYLEGIPQTVLSMVAPNMLPCDIKSMVVVISKDLKAKVYINEFDIEGIALVKAKKVEAGQAVTKDDLSGFERISLKGIEFPEDHAFFCVLSFQWDRVYVFDFSPLTGIDEIIEYDVEEVLGKYFSYLTFKTFHKISDVVLEALLKQNWFPFYALSISTIESIISYAKSGWEIDELLENIEKDTLMYIEERQEIWDQDQKFSAFNQFLMLAVARHREGDFVSSVSILYPKIEALIRHDFVKDNPGKQGRKSELLVQHVTQKTLKNIAALTTFIPEKFKRYLAECYFKEFSHDNFDNQISRHSVAHGASSIDKYNKKASLLGFLVYSQIVEYLKQSNRASIK